MLTALSISALAFYLAATSPIFIPTFGYYLFVILGCITAFTASFVIYYHKFSVKPDVSRYIPSGSQKKVSKSLAYFHIWADRFYFYIFGAFIAGLYGFMLVKATGSLTQMIVEPNTELSVKIIDKRYKQVIRSGECKFGITLVIPDSFNSYRRCVSESFYKYHNINEIVEMQAIEVPFGIVLIE